MVEFQTIEACGLGQITGYVISVAYTTHAGGLLEVRGKVAYHGRKWQVHVASTFPSERYYRAVFG